MEKNQIIEEFSDRLHTEGNLFMYTIDDDLPETFVGDMNRLFGSDPEKDILSNVYWYNDVAEEEGWCGGAVLVAIRKEMTKEEACALLAAYQEEKELDFLNLLYNGEEGVYDFINCYESEFAKNDTYPLLISDGNMIMADGENLWLGEETKPGIHKG